MPKARLASHKGMISLREFESAEGATAGKGVQRGVVMDPTPNPFPKGTCSLDLLSYEVITASRMIGLHINRWRFL